MYLRVFKKRKCKKAVSPGLPTYFFFMTCFDGLLKVLFPNGGNFNSLRTVPVEGAVHVVKSGMDFFSYGTGLSCGLSSGRPGCLWRGQAIRHPFYICYFS